MAKICPLTSKAVIYLTCMECEQKVECRAGRLLKNNKPEYKKEKE